MMENGPYKIAPMEVESAHLLKQLNGQGRTCNGQREGRLLWKKRFRFKKNKYSLFGTHYLLVFTAMAGIEFGQKCKDPGLFFRVGSGI